MKKLLIIAAALVLLVLFPGLAPALAEIVGAVAVWLSTQPILIGFGLGLIALPHLRRASKTTTP
ncbi:hypothetical protein PV409_37865 [Streptomyces sp. ME02-6979.5a]|uniref:hypothetical protein n=1 Tax=unclassified Streptomyces TaxID=2593676 RepID=UPI0029BEF041|nr:MULTISPECIES: hypothetical protein [unclassified Streptomyces]MDX3343721.1 hypothetical protein [Streptomyces sp. ME02-6979.5a]MDX5526189.1 hypothetical protein [Streptomyces sp. DE06-01C]